MRRFVIGDIHGCAKALRTVIESIQPTADDHVIFLGDYIDRGSDSRNVVDQIIELQKQCRVIPLRGNHEIMLLGVLLGGCDSAGWLASGGRSTLASYGGTLSRIPATHLQFFQSLRPFHETETEIFVHAGYHPEHPMNMIDDAVAYWNHLPFPPPPPHFSEKTVFLGHTPQADGNVLDAGHVVCVDTYCFGGGYLTALDVDSREIFQADLHGHQRRYPQNLVKLFAQRCYRYLSAKFHRQSAPGLFGEAAGQDA